MEAFNVLASVESIGVEANATKAVFATLAGIIRNFKTVCISNERTARARRYFAERWIRERVGVHRAHIRAMITGEHVRSNGANMLQP